MKKLVLLILAVVTIYSCGNTKESEQNNTIQQQPVAKQEQPANTTKSGEIMNYSVKVKSKIQHDQGAFTQGLIFSDGILYESTGQYGSSSLRKINPATGELLNKIPIPAMYFSEGIALLNNKLYMLTWMNGICFVYNPEDFKQTGTFKYEGEGWGLTTDSNSLIMSDGTNILRYINPENFNIDKTMYVSEKGTPVGALNELEYIDGNIWANIWGDDRIAVIKPETGNIIAWIDLKPLRNEVRGINNLDVLNGIAYDASTKTIYLTGKYWPWIFVVEYIKVD